MAALHDLIQRLDWKRTAACATYDPELWWIEDPHDRGRQIALEICGECPVKAQCLEHALEQREEHGIWGGMLPYQRKRLRVHRRAQAVA